jgi:hypothetical protein
VSATDISCQAVGGLLTRWYDGVLTGVEADAYEQHILLCRPCQVQNDKLRTALSALPEVADSAVGTDLVADLVRRAAALRDAHR